MKEEKILFFDDEELTSASLVKNLVINYSHDITSVSTISEFIKELKTQAYSLLIIDVMAPIPPDLESFGFEKDEIEEMKDAEGMNTGVMLAARAWKMETYRDVPVIFLTARANLQLPRKDKCRIIQKPQLAKNISSEIESLLKKG